MEGENKDQDMFDLNKLPVNVDGDHPDHQIDRNVDQDSLKNKENDVTGASVTSRGESSSSGARKRPFSPPPIIRNPDPLLGYIPNNDGGLVPVYYSETIIQTPSTQGSDFALNVDNLNLNCYTDMGLHTAEFNSDTKLTGVIVGPIVFRMLAEFRVAPMYGGRNGETRVMRRFVSDMPGDSSSKDSKKAKQ